MPANDTPVVIFLADDYGALGIMRSLGRMGVPVYAIDPSPDALGLASRYCAGRFIWDFPHASASESVAFLRDVARTIGGRPLLIHRGDAEATFLAEHQGELEDV